MKSAQSWCVQNPRKVRRPKKTAHKFRGLNRAKSTVQKTAQSRRANQTAPSILKSFVPSRAYSIMQLCTLDIQLIRKQLLTFSS
jgi:hypothetical protein